MAPTRIDALAAIGALDREGQSVPRKTLAGWLRELPAVEPLPVEYRKRVPVSVLLPLAFGVGAAVVLGLGRRVRPGTALALVAAAFGVTVVASVVRLLSIRRRTISALVGALRNATPVGAAEALARIRPAISDAAALRAPDVLFRGLAQIEDWAGDHRRAAAVSHAALASVDGPRGPAWIGGMAAELVRSLALAGDVAEARRWVTWGEQHLSPGFDGASWMGRALLQLREADSSGAVSILEARLEDPAKLAEQTGREARVLLSFARGESRPAEVPVEMVKFMGSAWPELAAFLSAPKAPLPL